MYVCFDIDCTENIWEIGYIVIRRHELLSTFKPPYWCLQLTFEWGDALYKYSICLLKFISIQNFKLLPINIRYYIIQFNIGIRFHWKLPHYFFFLNWKYRPLINNKADRTLDVVYSRFRGFSFTIAQRSYAHAALNEKTARACA